MLAEIAVISLRCEAFIVINLFKIKPDKTGRFTPSRPLLFFKYNILIKVSLSPAVFFFEKERFSTNFINRDAVRIEDELTTGKQICNHEGHGDRIIPRWFNYG